MKQVLDKFKTTDGIAGAYVLNPENNVYENGMPTRFDEEKLLDIGRGLMDLGKLAGSDFSKLSDVSVFFENGVLRIQDFNQGYHFISMFAPDMNQGVLDKALQTVIEELNESLAVPRLSPETKSLGKDSGPEISSSRADGMTVEGLMASETLAAPLEMMQSALVKVLGPIAEIVFFDALEQWLKLAAPSMESIPMLVDILTTEIGDADLAKGFKEKLPSKYYSSSSHLPIKDHKTDINPMNVV